MGTRIDGSNVANTLTPADNATPSNLGSAVDQARDAAGKLVKLKGAVKDGFEAAKKVKDGGLRTAYAQAKQDLVQKAQAGNVKLSATGLAMKGLTAAGVAVSLYQIPGKVMTTVKDIRSALRGDGSWNKVVSDVASTGKSTAIAARGSLELARDVSKGVASYKAAANAFRAVAPDATKGLVRATAGKAMLTSLEGLAKGSAKSAVVAKAFEAAKSGEGMATLVGVADRAAAKAALTAGGKAAAEAALEAGARSAAGPIARAAGRFAPGVNIAIAAFDTANAVATVSDPHASTGKKVCSVITAVGSIAAATNIPVVSQVGAAVSVVSSLVGGFFFSK